MTLHAKGQTSTTTWGAAAPEVRAGVRLWEAIDDPGWMPTDENLGFMALAPFTVHQALRVLRLVLAGQSGLRWTWGVESLVQACMDRGEELARLAEAEGAELHEAVLWALARRGRRSAADLPAGALGRIAGWFVAPTPDPDPRQPEAWWPGWEGVWDAGLWWQAVVEVLLDLKRPVSGSARIRRAWHHADERQRAILVARLFPGAPRWTLTRVAQLGPASWETLMDLAEEIVRGGDAQPWLKFCAPGTAVALNQLAVRLDRGLEPGFYSVLLRHALDVNRQLDAVDSLNEALQALPEEHRQRLMLEAPYLRWRHLPAAPTQTVIDWAVGEIASLTARSFQALERNHPDGEFHFGRSADDLRLIAAEALGAAGPASVPFLIDGLTRAQDANKVVFATALAVQQSPDAIPVLVHALAQGSTAVREVVQQGLAAFGDALLPEIQPLLVDERRPVRAAAALVLSRMEPTADVRELAGRVLLDEEAPEIRSALASISDAPTLPPELADVLAREAAVPRLTRRALTEALRASQGRGWRDQLELGLVVLGPVVAMYADGRAAGNPDVADTFLDAVATFCTDPGAAWVVGRVADHPRFEPDWLLEASELLGDALAAPLVWRARSGPPERRRAMLQAVVRLAPGGGVRELVRTMASVDPDVRKLCQEGLRAAGDAAIGPLREALRSEDPATRQQAALALERLPDPEHGPALRAAIQAEVDGRNLWVMHRALAVSLVESGPQQDRALDRLLGQQKTSAASSYVVEMALPALAWRSGVPMSAEARGWVISAMATAGERVDWFLPLSHSARLLWAIRMRIDDRAAAVLLDDIRRQSRGVEPADAAPMLAIAAALFATESEIEALAARVADPAWRGPTPGRRLTFPDGDPRVLFLRGSPVALRAVLDLYEWSAHPVLLAWCREAVRRLGAAIGMTTPELDAAARPAGAWTVAQARQELTRRMRSADALPLARWLQELRDPTFARVVGGVVMDSLDREGHVRDRFRWRAGVAEDGRGEPVVVDVDVRVSDPLDWSYEERELWRGLLPDGVQPIGQIAAHPSDADTDREMWDTGWLETPILGRRLLVSGYHLMGVEDPVPGGREVFPAPTVLRALRPLDESWAARMDLTPVRAWAEGAADPPVARVMGWSASFRTRQGRWRERPRGEMPWLLRRLVYADLAWMDRDSDRESGVESLPVRASDVEERPVQQEPAGSELPQAQEAARPRRRAEAEAPIAPKNMWERIFGSKEERRRQEEARALDEARKRREDARKRAEEARRLAEEARRAAPTEQRAREASRSSRWSAAEEALVEARAARAARLRIELEERRSASRLPGDESTSGLLARRLHRDLDQYRGASSAVAIVPEARRPVLRAVAADLPEQEGLEAGLEDVPVEVGTGAAAIEPAGSAPRPAGELRREEESEEPSNSEAVANWLAERSRRTAEARRAARQKLQDQRSRREPVPSPNDQPATGPSQRPPQPARVIELTAELIRRVQETGRSERQAGDQLGRWQVAQLRSAEKLGVQRVAQALAERPVEPEPVSTAAAPTEPSMAVDAGGFLALDEPPTRSSPALVEATDEAPVVVSSTAGPEQPVEEATSESTEPLDLEPEAESTLAIPLLPRPAGGGAEEGRGSTELSVEPASEPDPVQVADEEDTLQALLAPSTEEGRRADIPADGGQAVSGGWLGLEDWEEFTDASVGRRPAGAHVDAMEQAPTSTPALGLPPIVEVHEAEQPPGGGDGRLPEWPGDAHAEAVEATAEVVDEAPVPLARGDEPTDDPITEDTVALAEPWPEEPAPAFLEIDLEEEPAIAPLRGVSPADVRRHVDPVPPTSRAVVLAPLPAPPPEVIADVRSEVGEVPAAPAADEPELAALADLAVMRRQLSLRAQATRIRSAVVQAQAREARWDGVSSWLDAMEERETTLARAAATRLRSMRIMARAGDAAAARRAAEEAEECAADILMSLFDTMVVAERDLASAVLAAREAPPAPDESAYAASSSMPPGEPVGDRSWGLAGGAGGLAAGSADVVLTDIVAVVTWSDEDEERALDVAEVAVRDDLTVTDLQEFLTDPIDLGDLPEITDPSDEPTRIVPRAAEEVPDPRSRRLRSSPPRLSMDADPLDEHTDPGLRVDNRAWTLYDPNDSEETQVTRPAELLGLLSDQDIGDENTMIHSEESWTAEYTMPAVEPMWPTERTATDAEPDIPLIEIDEFYPLDDEEPARVDVETLRRLREGRGHDEQGREQSTLEPGTGLGGWLRGLIKKIGG